MASAVATDTGPQQDRRMLIWTLGYGDLRNLALTGRHCYVQTLRVVSIQLYHSTCINSAS